MAGDVKAFETLFQLTRSRGARRDVGNAISEEAKNFNSRAHVERDAAYNKGTSIAINFNSRAHVERDTQKATKSK